MHSRPPAAPGIPGLDIRTPRIHAQPQRLSEQQLKESELQGNLVEKQVLFSRSTGERSSAFRVFIHDGAAEFRLSVKGNFTAGDVREVEQRWRTAASIIGDRAFVVDLCGVTSWDSAVGDLLERMQKSGARLLPATAPGLSQPPPAPAAEPIRAGASPWRSRLCAAVSDALALIRTLARPSPGKNAGIRSS
jgi:hypothetical protein